MTTTDDRRNMRDPRNQPDGAHDEDKHGRKKNTGTNQPGRREAGSAGEIDRERQPSRPSRPSDGSHSGK